ncbi:MAG: tat pathway signal sequence domain protein [Betaproteobacteria bacterium]|nr:tat pathway signal sequence domain protein [Betaproteobacteria bacterium]
MRARVLSALILSAAALMAGNAHAGEYFETDGLAIGGYDPVAYLTEQRAAVGSAQFTATHRGSVFRFVSAVHRDTFIAAPDKFAPQYGGFCAFGASRGYKAVTTPETFSIVEGKLYLNYNAEVKAMWTKDVSGYIAKADRQWAEVAKTTKVAR